MKISFKPALVCESLAEPVASCPTLDVSVRGCSADELWAFIREFSASYYGLAIDHITVQTNLYCDLEAHLYGKTDDQHVSYGKFGIDPRDPQNTGISDQGMSVYWYLNDLLDALGMDVSCDSGESAAGLEQAHTLGEMWQSLQTLLLQQGKLV